MKYRDMTTAQLRQTQRKLFEGDTLGVLSGAPEAYSAVERELDRRQKLRADGAQNVVPKRSTQDRHKTSAGRED